MDEAKEYSGTKVPTQNFLVPLCCLSALNIGIEYYVTYQVINL